jgi:hypothetical protein
MARTIALENYNTSREVHVNNIVLEVVTEILLSMDRRFDDDAVELGFVDA